MDYAYDVLKRAADRLAQVAGGDGGGDDEEELYVSESGIVHAPGVSKLIRFLGG